MSNNKKLHEMLQLRAEQVRTGAEIVMQKTLDWQVIREFMNNRNNEIPLTADQEKKVDRYKYIYDQLSTGRYTKAQVINQLMNKKLFGISMRQAYEDIRLSNELFTSVIKIDKQFELKNEIEIAKAARERCHQIFDFRSGAAYSKVIKDLLALLPDEEAHPGEDFEGHLLEGVFDPQLLGAPKIDMKELLTILNKNRNVPINIDMFEHLVYEEVKDEKADPLK